MEKNTGLALSRENLKLIAIGFVIIVIGFALMIGSSADVEFDREIFSFRRISLGPVVAVFGFFFEIYAILSKPRNASEAEKGNSQDIEDTKNENN